MMNVVGVRRVDYTSKAGKRVIGYNVYVTYPAPSPDIEGDVAESIYLSDAVLGGRIPRVDSLIDVHYGRSASGMAYIMDVDF